MSTFVIVPGAWDTPSTLEPLIEPLESVGHEAIVVDLPCGNADATLAEYADAVRAVLPDDLADVVLVGYSFGGFTAARIAVEHPDVPAVYIAAWIPRDGASVLDLFAGGDPFVAGEEAGIAAFGGMFLSAGPGLCALNIDRYVEAVDPEERDSVRAYLERTQRPQGITALREKWRGDLPSSRRCTYVQRPQTPWCRRRLNWRWRRRWARRSSRSIPITDPSASSPSDSRRSWSRPPADRIGASGVRRTVPRCSAEPPGSAELA